MDTQNEPNPQHSALSVTAILSIISVVIAAGWIAFAYYKGSADNSQTLLLHPIVPIVLTVLLIRVYRWIDLKSIVILEILMITTWVFVRLLGVLTPFILGFGFAYIFRFLWNTIPFKARYLRAVTTVIIVLVCGGVFFYTGQQVSKQARQMGSGLLKFYHETLLPYAVGETFEAIAIRTETAAATDDAAAPDPTFYLGTNHGIYEIRQDEKAGFVRAGITNEALLGKSVQTLATGGNTIYAGTKSGLYRYYIASPNETIEGEATNAEKPEPKVWHKLKGTAFDTVPIQALNVPPWNNTEIYVGTPHGLYNSKDSGQTWQEVAPEIYTARSIVGITAAANTNGDRTVYVASTRNIDPTDSEQTTSEVPTTTVHWHLEGSSVEWSLLSSLAYPIYALTSGTDLQTADVELYAGTADGLYEWHRFDAWRKTEDTATISLLASAPSAVYIGDKTAIRYRTSPADGWHPFVSRNEGLSHNYRDEPIVQQAKAYLTERIPTIAQMGSDAIREGFQFAGSIAFGFGGFLATLSLAFIVFVYASQSFDAYFRSFMTFVPDQHREHVKTYLREIDRNLQQFLKGQVAVIAIISVVSCIIYSIIGVPFALVIGLLAGFCNAIPTFGPFIGGGFAFVAMLMGLAAGDFSLVDFLIRSAFVLVAILGIQMLDNSLISPKIMSSAVDVDPLLIMFAVIVGAAVLGFWGVLLAIPIIVVIKSVIAVSQSLASDRRLAAEEEH